MNCVRYWALDWRYLLSKRVERWWHWLARHVPRRLAYWCVVTCFAKATSGEYGSTDCSDLTMVEVLTRVEKMGW